MRKIDYLLRNWRYRIVAPHVPDKCRILDIGGLDGSFLMYMYDKIEKGVCIDPLIEDRKLGKLEFARYHANDDLPYQDSSFDVVTMLAVYEHLGASRELITSEIYRIVRDQGIVILTVPSAAVDPILKVLAAVRLIDGMSIEEHNHFNSSDTIKYFEKCGFSLKLHDRFQLGLNNLFIFKKGE